eukprot:Gb_38882 [translate_table: standard]
MGAFRHLLACSLPHLNSRGREADSEIDIILEDNGGKAEVEAVWRHLEVRWQMFNEALSKFCDLEALLAFFTDDVIWSNHKADLARGKDKELLAFLQSLITRKLSVEVELERVTKLTSTGCLDLTLDKDGNYGKLSGSEIHKENAALNMFLPGKTNHELGISGSRSELPLMVLEKDGYILHNDQGERVESGRRFVLWKQLNATWYIFGYRNCPLEIVLPMV